MLASENMSLASTGALLVGNGSGSDSRPSHDFTENSHMHISRFFYLYDPIPSGIINRVQIFNYMSACMEENVICGIFLSHVGL